MKRNQRERKEESEFANVFDHDSSSLLRFLRPVVRRMAQRRVKLAEFAHCQ